jgi:hypothetical protein
MPRNAPRRKLAFALRNGGCGLAPSNEDAAYVVEIPELPGCMAHGKTRSEAIARLKPPSACGSKRPRKTAWESPRLEGVWPMRERYSAFCILHSDFCS